MMQTSSITLVSMVRLGLYTPRGKFFCLSVSRLCVNGIIIKLPELRNGFDTSIIGQGMLLLHNRIQLCLCAARWHHHRMLNLTLQSNLVFSPFNTTKQSR